VTVRRLPPPTSVAALALFLLALIVPARESGGEPAGPRPQPKEPKRGQTARVPETYPPAVLAAARGLTPGQQAAQLMLVDARGAAAPPDPVWGALEGRPAGRARRGRRGKRGAIAPLVISHELPAQPRLGRLAPAKVERRYQRAGTALRRTGASLAVGLSADVAATAGPLAGVAFGDDPAEITPRVRAALAGLSAARMPAAIGHFPGQGAATQDPLDGPAGVGLSPAGLRDRDLVPFRAALSSAPAVVVSSAAFAAYDGATPASLSPTVVRGELRGRLGYRGVAMTDDLTGVTTAAGTTTEAAAVAALRAGIDLVDVGDERRAAAARDAVVTAMRSGALRPARVREAVLRVLDLTRRAGLLG